MLDPFEPWRARRARYLPASAISALQGGTARGAASVGAHHEPSREELIVARLALSVRVVELGFSVGREPRLAL
eukprot:1715112-Pyramimonas_sp.AAC.1